MRPISAPVERSNCCHRLQQHRALQHLDQRGDVVAGGVAGQLFEHRAFDVGQRLIGRRLVADRVGDQQGKGTFVNGAKDALVGGEQVDSRMSRQRSRLRASCDAARRQSSRRSISSSVLPIWLRQDPHSHGLNVAGIEVIALVRPPDSTFNMTDGVAT